MIDGKFRIELLLASIGVGMILQHLEGVTSGSEEVNGLLSLTVVSVHGNLSVTGTWVTPTMGTWGVPLWLMKWKLVLSLEMI